VAGYTRVLCIILLQQWRERERESLWNVGHWLSWSPENTPLRVALVYIAHYMRYLGQVNGIPQHPTALDTDLVSKGRLVGATSCCARSLLVC
jgi:hypothetical protein